MSDVPTVTELLNSGPESVEAEAEPVVEEPTTGEAPEAMEETPDTESADSTPESKEEPKPETATVPLAAMLDEREKRQELQRRLEALEANKPPEKTVDPLEDPEGFQAAIDKKFTDYKFEQSRAMMMTVKDDYEAMEQLFAEEASKSPFLQDQLRKAANPALLAYQEGQRIAERQKAPEVNTELQKQVQELQAQLETLQKGGKAPAPNLAKAGQAAIQADPPEHVPSVSELLNSRNQT